MEIRVNSLSRFEWEGFADLGRALVQQRWDYGAAAQAQGRKSARLMIVHGDRPIAIAQVLHRPMLGIGLSTCLGGPVWLDDLALSSKQHIVESLSRSHPFRGPLILMPRDEIGGQGFGLSQIMTPSVLGLLPLLQDFSQMRRAMRGKWRNRLVSAENSALRVDEEQGTPERIAHLLSLEAAQRRTRRYGGLPLPFIQTLARGNPKDMRLFSARQKGALCAMMLHLCHGNTASYLVGWNDEKGRRNHAHNLLMWRSMQSLAQRGVTEMDLGTLNTVAAPGLARFKLGTGACAQPMGGAWARTVPSWRFRHQVEFKAALDKA